MTEKTDSELDLDEHGLDFDPGQDLFSDAILRMAFEEERRQLRHLGHGEINGYPQFTEARGRYNQSRRFVASVKRLISKYRDEQEI